MPGATTKNDIQPAVHPPVKPRQTSNTKKLAFSLLLAVASLGVFGSVTLMLVSKNTDNVSHQIIMEAISGSASRAATDWLFNSRSYRETNSIFGNQEDLRRYVETASIYGVRSMIVTDTKGVAVFPSADAGRSLEDEDALRSALDGQAVFAASNEGGDQSLYLPIRRGRETYGVLAVTYDWGTQRLLISQITRWVWGGLMTSAFVVTFILWASFRTLSRELRRRHRALTAILDHAPIGIYTVTPSGRIESFNPKMVELSGAGSADKVIGLNVFEMSSYRDAGLDESIRAGLQGRKFDKEIEYVSFTAARHTWRRYSGVPILLPNGKTVDRLLLLVEDISQQKQLEAKNAEYASRLEKYVAERTQQLEETEQRLQIIVNRLPVIFWAVDKEGVFTVLEGSRLEAINLEPKKCIGQSAFDVYKDFPALVSDLQRTLKGETFSNEVQLKDRYFQAHFLPLRDDQDAVVGGTGIFVDATERHQAEERFSAMINNSADLMTVINLDGRIEFCTKSLKNILGYDPKDVIGKPVSNYIHPEDWSLIRTEMDRPAEGTDKAVTAIQRVRHKDGHYVSIESVGQNYLHDPRLKGIIINSRDITARLKIEEDLRHSIKTQTTMASISAMFVTLTDFRSAVEATLRETATVSGADHAFMATLKPDGQIKERYGWSADGQPSKLGAVFSEKDSAAWRELVGGGRPVSILDLNAKDSNDSSGISPLLERNGVDSFVILPITMDGDKPGGFISIATTAPHARLQDSEMSTLHIAAEIISSALQRQRALEEARLQANRQSALAAFSESIMTEDSVDEIISFALKVISGHLGSDLVKALEYRRPSDDFIVRGTLGEGSFPLGSALPGGLASHAGYAVLSRSTVSVQDFKEDNRFRASAPLLAAGIVGGAVVILGDTRDPWGVLTCHYKNRRFLSQSDLGFLEAVANLTTMGLRKAVSEERGRDLDGLKSKFIQVVSHQFRTPLSAVRWNLESLLSGDVGPLAPEMREFLRITYEANNEVINRVRDLLTVLDIEERRVTLNLEPVAFDSIVAGVAAEFVKRFDLKRVTLEKIMPEQPLPAMNVDQERCRSIIEKLLDNAISYTPSGGKVTLKLERDGDRVRVSVSDTGIGIPATEQKRIFERFYRASNATIARPDASGLGLTIAKYFVEQHDGRLSFTSKETEGSTFTFELPIR